MSEVLVALCEEGVDRNMEMRIAALQEAKVALCEEGVDRNSFCERHRLDLFGRPLRRGRG